MTTLADSWWGGGGGCNNDWPMPKIILKNKFPTDRYKDFYQDILTDDRYYWRKNWQLHRYYQWEMKLINLINRNWSISGCWHKQGHNFMDA
jgi:hypothetical protein